MLELDKLIFERYDTFQEDGAMMYVGAVNDPMKDRVSFEERGKQLSELQNQEREAEERAKKSTFKRWTQYNNEHTREMIWLAMTHPKAHAILYFLVDQMDYYNAIMCSHRVLEEVLGISTATIKRNMSVLKERGFIAVLKSGTSNVYVVNDKVFWKSWGKNKQYSKFPANVILSLSEQEAGYQKKLSTEKLKEVSLQEGKEGAAG
jgi:Fe2+ or Zn2+ uptake regulation protein